MPMGNQGGGNVRLMPRVTGRYYGWSTLGAMVAALVANRVYYIPLMIPESLNIASLAVNVATGGAGNVRLGVYSNLNGVPGALLFTAGTASVAVAGVKDIALNQTLAAGNYWLACHSDAAAAFLSYAVAFAPTYFMDYAGETTPGTQLQAYYQSSAYAGGLPANASGLTVDIASSVVGTVIKA